MAKRVRLQVRDVPVKQDDVVETLNRETLPLLRALRNEFNSSLPAESAVAYSVTNAFAERRTFDTTTVTLPQLAEVVATIIADLQAQGHLL